MALFSGSDVWEPGIKANMCKQKVSTGLIKVVVGSLEMSYMALSGTDGSKSKHAHGAPYGTVWYRWL